MSHITITIRDYDSATRREVLARRVVDVKRGERDLTAAERWLGTTGEWGPCRCPLHRPKRSDHGIAPA